MIISFAGHSLVRFHDKVKELVKKQIRKHIDDTDVVSFYLGGYGDFDNICARACKELKKEYSGIELVYVTPYRSLSEQSKINDWIHMGFYDTSLYPPIENTPPKFAISKRNEWMMANADLVIVYVNRSYGGAFQSLQAAKRKKKKIINICDLLE